MGQFDLAVGGRVVSAGHYRCPFEMDLNGRVIEPQMMMVFGDFFFPYDRGW